MTNIILVVLAVVRLILMIGGWGFMIYKDIRDDIRNERERKTKLEKNKEQLMRRRWQYATVSLSWRNLYGNDKRDVD